MTDKSPNGAPARKRPSPKAVDTPPADQTAGMKLEVRVAALETQVERLKKVLAQLLLQQMGPALQQQLEDKLMQEL